MANILTATEAANVLRCAVDDPKMVDLLPVIDKTIEKATGRDWANDDPIYALAKDAARILLWRMYEDPGGIVRPAGLMDGALNATYTMLEAEARRLAEAAEL